MDLDFLWIILPLLLGWFTDFIWGDPEKLPHPIVWFGKIISYGEKKLNRGKRKKLKGGIFSILLIVLSYLIVFFVQQQLYGIHLSLGIAFSSIIIFYCLAGTTLIKEVRQVFLATDKSLEDGRNQVARIVGRDTSQLNAQQIRTAALETASENLSDGVIAPLFWYLLLGVPGMFAYKMINTLDSMIAYKSKRYKDFGCWAAHIDDVANYLPARLTAFLMILSAWKFSLFSFIRKFRKCHSSPNAIYPEAALAGILDCRFGGPNNYFGEIYDKPYIGTNPKELTTEDMKMALNINRKVEVLMVLIIIGCSYLIYIF